MALINCPECGNEVSDQADSCPHCGMTLKEAQKQPININMNSGSSVKCPRCGSSNLQAVSDTHGKGASFWKLCFCGLLGLCGAGKTKTDHYWVCQSCGNKFKM
ncbi:MAG: zinc ribbon domain-containing protein [Ruminococcus flavefaciens]|nr:zinc ribbon domain-containing protein [Ruminococcus flavefaciens]